MGGARNPGIAALAETVPIGVLDIAALVAFAQENAVDLCVPGPEAPLVAGLADAMEAAGVPCCGPSAAAARLEGSKAFTKEIAEPPKSPPPGGSSSPTRRRRATSSPAAACPSW